MGCCISQNPTKQPPRLPPPHYAIPSLPRPVSRPTASTIPLEKEAVKEVVLSEPPPPPLPSPSPLSPAEEDDSTPMVVRPQPFPSPSRPKLPLQVFIQPRTPRKLDTADPDFRISKLKQVADVVSEYSDKYTLNGSHSVSTTPTTGTAATLNDCEVTSKVSRPVARTQPNRVPRKCPPFVGGDARPDCGSGSQGRKLHHPSPKTGRRESAPTGRDLVGLRRNAGRAVSDPRLRSSSPTQRRDGIGNSPSKRTGSSGNRSSSLSCPAPENVSNPPRCKKRFPEEDVSDRRNDVGGFHDSAAYESLYNPHVSLECFVFL